MAFSSRTCVHKKTKNVVRRHLPPSHSHVLLYHLITSSAGHRRHQSPPTLPRSAQSRARHFPLPTLHRRSFKVVGDLTRLRLPRRQLQLTGKVVAHSTPPNNRSAAVVELLLVHADRQQAACALRYCTTPTPTPTRGQGKKPPRALPFVLADVGPIKSP